MCGIAGIIKKDGGLIDPDRIRRMNDLASHRGPDGSGYFCVPGLSLGHRRLAILDLHPRGAQPMARGDYLQIVFNGEIYNYLEIRLELERLGLEFYTGTDTEVILAAFDTWGPDCLNRFNGMWAFAIYDARDRSIFLARDRFGVKPLYYTDQADVFGFASEIKQVLSLLPRTVACQSAVLDWLVFSHESYQSQSMFDGVQSLPPGHFMRVQLPRATHRIERWYTLRPNPAIAILTEPEVAALLRDTLEDSIKLRLRADVRVGTSLSGGLDSSAVSTLASRQYRHATHDQFLGIHARATEHAIDESRWATLVADREGIDLSIITPTVDDFARTIDDVVYTQEEPFRSPSIFMSWLVFAEARAKNCPVMLNGQGADEVFLGYERYFTAATAQQPWWQQLVSTWHESRRSRLGLWQALKYRAYFQLHTQRKNRNIRRSFLRASFAEKVNHEFFDRACRASMDIYELQHLEITCSQLPSLLRYEDRNSMRHSIETRLPFLDYRVVELGLSIPVDYKIRKGWTKLALREAMVGILPDIVIWRTNKLGFESPSATWMMSYENRMREEIAGSNILRTICDIDKLLKGLGTLDPVRQWQFLNLAVWERIFDVQWE